jgi:hypothetical protein
LDALENGVHIIRSYVQLPERWALRCVVKITVSDGVVTSKFDVTERKVVATGGDPPSGDPQNVVVEGRRGLDVGDADQDANQTTHHVELLTSGLVSLPPETPDVPRDFSGIIQTLPVSSQGRRAIL